MNTPRIPPRFVPTLTTVLEVPAPAPPAVADDPREAVALGPAARLSELESFALEEQLMHRVLQRIDGALEERLSDVVSAAVQVQLDAMVPRLRSEIEAVLRTLVVESLAQELGETLGSNPPKDASSLG
ncbi:MULTISPECIES: hypothetical protein [unclassified Variovorax]|uniref:hypothetical protein n=1 Tax=unclassified Variovorax TaxID=663243 RepID=UPI002578F67A|nr:MULTISPECIES: hypothetical protein [unclassified Variovorax]MDM0086309.1 hypothetical protein [Variovorax sp. J22G40]MDM0145434.1 hypothetical protein [Variovorax sp. J2P1-31]